MEDLAQFKKFAKTKQNETEVNRNVWLYTRVSSKDQYVNQSLANQHESGERYCETNEYNLIKVFGGTYESASGDFTRTEFKKLIQSIRRAKRKPFAILIFKMSRFSRTGGSAIALATELIEALGVHLIEISSGKNTLTERGKLEIYERLLKAREENIERLEMTMPGMQKFLRNGNWLGVAPRGYDHYGPRVKDVSKLRGEQELVINEEGRLLRKAWGWKFQKIRDCDIAKKLSDLGMNFNSKQLGKMWRNPFYCGLIVHNMLDGEIVNGKHQPLISKQKFLIINERLDAREKRRTYVDNDQLPLNKFVVGVCGYSYSGYMVKSKGIYYYKNNRVGSRENINAKKLHASFLELLSHHQIKDKALINALSEILVQQFHSKYSEKIKRAEIQKSKLKDIKSKLERLEERFVYEEISKEQYDKFRVKLIDDQIAIEKNFSSSKLSFSNPEILIKTGIEYSSKLVDMWQQGSFHQKLVVQNMVFPKGIIYDFKNQVSRTSYVNSIFASIPSLSTSCKNIKKGINLKNEIYPSVVAGARLELATFGL